MIFPAYSCKTALTERKNVKGCIHSAEYSSYKVYMNQKPCIKIDRVKSKRDLYKRNKQKNIVEITLIFNSNIEIKFTWHTFLPL